MGKESYCEAGKITTWMPGTEDWNPDLPFFRDPCVGCQHPIHLEKRPPGSEEPDGEGVVSRHRMTKDVNGGTVTIRCICECSPTVIYPPEV